LFAAATSGTPTTIYTGDAKLLYKPSSGELQSTVLLQEMALWLTAKQWQQATPLHQVILQCQLVR
jgi:hypothetical protein